MIADLHCHSTASDGTYPPEKLIQAALRKKIKVLSVTDHDTIDALPIIQDLCEKVGITFIPGIEISCHCQEEEVHILAYGMNQTSQDLLHFLAQQKENRQARLHAMIHQLEQANVHLSWEEVKHHIHSESAAGRPHIARALVYKGYSSSLHDAFVHYLTPGKPGYVPRSPILAEKVLEIIKDAGGISSLAHPGFLKKQEILDKLFMAGLQGIEAFHPTHKAWQKNQYEKWGVERKMFITGGSDFHGDKIKGHGALGSMKIPEEHINKLLENIV